MEKKNLRFEELEAQTALELPDREMLCTLVNVRIKCLGVCIGSIVIKDIDLDVAFQVCTLVKAINVELLQFFNVDGLVCEIQRGGSA